jgi:hypothetical protein
MLGWSLGERSDPFWAGAVQGGVDLGDGGVELVALSGKIGEILVTTLLMLGEGGETLAKLARCGGRPLGSAHGEVELCLGVEDGLLVLAAPPSPADSFEVDLAVSQLLFGLVALSDHLG